MQVPHIRKQEIVTIELGTKIIRDIQAVLSYLVEGKSQQELAALREHVAKGTLAPWESSAICITRLMQVIFDSAKEHGQLEFKSLEEIIGSQSSKRSPDNV